MGLWMRSRWVWNNLTLALGYCRAVFDQTRCVLVFFPLVVAMALYEQQLLSRRCR